MNIQLEKLVIFRDLYNDPYIKSWVNIINNSKNSTNEYYKLVSFLLSNNFSLNEYIIRTIIESNNPYLNKLVNSKDLLPVDYASLKNDLTIIKKLFLNNFQKICESLEDNNLLLHLIQNKDFSKPIITEYYNFFKNLYSNEISNNICKKFIALIKKYGIGKFALYNAFFIDDNNNVKYISDFNPLPINSLYEYEYQKNLLIQNTKAFVNEKPYHNVLLVGSSGTGKSSSVKALIPLFSSKKLKLLQIQKSQFYILPLIVEKLINSCFKFIIFVDDLSFETNEESYKYLKSFIEGSIFNKSTNIVFYVTSNRRHLIKEIRSERENEIHLTDSIEEMTSLSDRFGITLIYEAPNQKTYINIIKNMLHKQGINIKDEILIPNARQWSLEHGGMSGRTAEQFVKYLLVQNNHDNLI